MSFDFSSLVIDRTQADVDARNNKGTYNASDLNRVTAAMVYLKNRLANAGYDVPGYIAGKIWADGDLPMQSSMAQYLKNLSGIRSVLALLDDVPNAPSTMEQFTFSRANEIEQILLAVEDAATRMEKVYPRCGIYTCGGVMYVPDQSYSWTIVDIPQQIGTLIYNGQEQSPNWGMDIGVFHITGGSAVDAGDYIAQVKPIAGYKWPDSSTAAKPFPWSIQKAQGVLSISPTLVMNKENWQTALQLTYNGDGVLSIQTDNKNVSAVLNGTTISLTSIKIGKTVLTVTATEGKNFLAAKAVQCEITISDIIRIDQSSGEAISGNITYFVDIYR